MKNTKVAWMTVLMGAVTLSAFHEAMACPGGEYDVKGDHEVLLRGDSVWVVGGLQTQLSGKAVDIVGQGDGIHVGTKKGLSLSFESIRPGAPKYQVKVISQRSDDQGVFWTRYAVIATRYLGPDHGSVNTTQVKVTTNYGGNGSFNRGCGEVEVTPAP